MSCRTSSEFRPFGTRYFGACSGGGAATNVAACPRPNTLGPVGAMKQRAELSDSLSSQKETRAGRFCRLLDTGCCLTACSYSIVKEPSLRARSAPFTLTVDVAVCARKGVQKNGGQRPNSRA